jgi:hypothetical protein
MAVANCRMNMGRRPDNLIFLLLFSHVSPLRFSLNNGHPVNVFPCRMTNEDILDSNGNREIHIPAKFRKSSPAARNQALENILCK